VLCQRPTYAGLLLKKASNTAVKKAWCFTVDLCICVLVNVCTIRDLNWTAARLDKLCLGS